MSQLMRGIILAKINWKTQFDQEKHKFLSNPGEGVVKNYSSRLDEKGNIVVFEDGETDLYGYIQSFADGCDIKNILKRFTNGDLSVLETRQGEFLDLTTMPSDFFEMMNAMNRGKELFASLDQETQEKFDYDPNKFLGTVGSDEWMSKLGYSDNKETESAPAVEGEV